MANKNHDKIEKLFKEIYDLKIEYRTYGAVIIDAATNAAICRFEGNDAGAEIFTRIEQGYTDKNKMISLRIQDLYAEAMLLKKEGET